MLKRMKSYPQKNQTQATQNTSPSYNYSFNGADLIANKFCNAEFLFIYVREISELKGIPIICMYNVHILIGDRNHGLYI